MLAAMRARESRADASFPCLMWSVNQSTPSLAVTSHKNRKQEGRSPISTQQALGAPIAASVSLFGVFAILKYTDISVGVAYQVGYILPGPLPGVLNAHARQGVIVRQHYACLVERCFLPTPHWWGTEVPYMYLLPPSCLSERRSLKTSQTTPPGPKCIQRYI